MSVPEDSSQPGINDDATIGFDADGRVLSVSDSAAAALGYARPEDVRGVLLADLVGDEAAIVLIDRAAAANELEEVAEVELAGNGPVSFVRQDGSRVSLNTIVTPETSGGWITILDPSLGGSAGGETPPAASDEIDIAAILRRLAEQSGSIGDVSEITHRFAAEMSAATGADAITVARSSAIAGIYEPIARVSQPGATSLTEAIDLPPALIPQQGSGPIAVDSLETLALFEPVIIYGEEFDGAYIAARADLHDGAHLLVIATMAGGRAWAQSATLLLESGVLTLAGTLRATELDRRIASYSRASETVRQIGALASRDHDGGFLDAARKIIARRLPVSAISIHVADPVTGRCYVPEASSAGDEEYGALAPGVEWPLAGSIEQRVLKTGAAVFTSAASSERLSVPPATIAHWRRSGLQAVVAIPLREAGEVVAIMLAGFSSPVSNPKEVIRLLESIAPAVHLGVGLSAARPSTTPAPEDVSDKPGFVPPNLLLALTRAAAESPDSATLFASVTEWMLEIIPSARIAWGTVDRGSGTYQRLYSYDINSAAHENAASVQLDADTVSGLDIPGLGLPEPGQPSGPAGSMRASVMADGRVLAVVTAWPREDEKFENAHLARLRRSCEFIPGPLRRVLEAESVRESQRRRELVAQIGTLAAEFTDEAKAFRSLRPKIAGLFPHDRALFVELDTFEEIATVRYDSDELPGETTAQTLSPADLPVRDIADAEEVVSFPRLSGAAASTSPLAGYESMLGIPTGTSDGPAGALLLLSASPQTISDQQTRLANDLSVHLKAAFAGWLAHRSERESKSVLIDVQKRLSLVLDSTTIALIAIDLEGICQSLEGHGLETLDIKREDMHARPIFDWAGCTEQVEDAIRQAMRGMTATALTSLGSHAIEVWTQPMTENDGSIKGVTVVVFDVSDRLRTKRANAEKRELQATLRERSETIERASHELRNQLQSITLHAEVLSVGAEKEFTQGQVDALSVIQKTTEKLHRMLRDLPGLDYELSLSEVDVSGLMREIVNTEGQTFKSAGQTLSLNLPERPYVLQADHLRITQVLTNLLSNASKYSPRGADVVIDVSVTDQQLNIAVSDTGPGIPADQMERVWDTGIRLASSATSKVEGSGLGLAIVRKIVEMHGGTASIESEVGFGTTVTVTLPGATPAKQRASRAGSRSRNGSAKSAATGSAKAAATVPVKRTKKTKSAGGQPARRRRRS